jgi:hypothetical protein
VPPIATLLAVCALVCGLFGFGFYKLMQPVQFPNTGLAAFKPPPGITTYPSAAQFTHTQPATSLPTANESLNDNAYQTTGQTIQTKPGHQTMEQTPPVALTRAPFEKLSAKKAVKSGSPNWVDVISSTP